jgi:phosphoribosylanthranilate isomerase
MPSHVRVKICGITSEADARQAVLLGADAVGLNFYPQSPRWISVEAAVPILHALPPFVEAVGVFVDQPLREVFPLLNQLGRLRTVQMHGTIREVCDAYPFHFIPAFAVKDQQSLTEVRRYLETCLRLGKLPSAVLIDGHAPGQHGGTGRNPPWELFRDVAWEVPLILAGGLTPKNVAEAVRIVQPYAVDVASGVEVSPGKKDQEKMRRFIESVRAAV